MFVQKDLSTTGNVSYHGLQIVGYHCGPGNPDSVSDEQIFSRHSLEVPAILHEIRDITFPVIKEPPHPNANKDIFDSTLDQDVEHAAHGMDFAFLLACGRKSAAAIKTSKSCNWIAFNQSLSHQKVQKTEIGYMPLLNAPADDYSTLYTAFQ